jgi:DNA transformation protein
MSPPPKSMKSRPIHLLPGIGPVSAGWLKEVGIETEADLRALGAAAAYRRLKHWDPRRVSLNALWALHGALTGVPWNKIDAETKARLIAEAGVTPPRSSS